MAAVTHEAHEIADEAAFGIQIGPQLVPLQYVVNDALSFAKAILLGLTLTLLVAVLLPAAKAFAADENASIAGRLVELPADQSQRQTLGAGPIAPSLASLLGIAKPIPGTEAVVRTFAISGDINIHMVNAVRAALDNGFRKIVITSRGGEMLAAREIAKMLSGANAELSAEGQCHSACAYMWLATPRHTLGPAANLAVHASYDGRGANDYGARWLVEMGRSDLAIWAKSLDMHYLTDRELNG